jgi:hyperosmotically inducible protein
LALRSIAFALFLVWSLLGCQTAQDRSLNPDDAITKAVKEALVEDRHMNLLRVDVDTDKGIVYLSGDVDAPQHKLRAEQIARKVGGVSDVVNKIQVEP